VCGIEIEWWHGHLGPRAVEAEHVAMATLSAIQRSHPYLPDGGRGVFLENGCRVYLDVGHCEFASAECSSPAELVAQVKAFERLLVKLAPTIAADLGGGQTIFARLNVDHLSASFGTHLSVLTRRPPADYARPMIPFLVAKTIVGGEGGLALEGSRLAVSPRMLHIGCACGHDTVHNKPIFCLRDEPLAGEKQKSDVYRLHATCYSTLASELAWYLTTGFSALVVRAIELSGECAADRLQLDNPVAAMHTVAADLSCRERLLLTNGRKATAIEIMKEYLTIVRRQLGQLPDWAGDVCGRMEQTLDTLADDPRRLVGALDWPTKVEIYEKQRAPTEDRGSDILAQLYAAARHTAFGDRRPPLAVLLGPSSPVLETVARLNVELRRRGLRWDECRTDDSERLRLAEIDVRFGHLGEGIFDQLHRQGLLRHTVITDADIERATAAGPVGTRAALRGRAVRRFAGTAGMTCTWQGVYQHRRRRVMDLRNPWQKEERWVPIQDFDMEEERQTPAFLRALGDTVR